MTGGEGDSNIAGNLSRTTELVRNSATRRRGLGRHIATVTHVGSDVPLAVAKPLILARIMSRVVISASGCWVWRGWCNTLGYGEGNFCGRRWMVHRLVYTLERGEIAPGMHACHTCDNPKCVNPDHIFIGSRKDNMSDCRQKGRHFLASKTHCKRGHPLSGDNLGHKQSGVRVCKTCVRARFRIAAGWPEDLAYSLPVMPFGWRPENAGAPKPRGKRKLKTECIHGHPMSGENLVVTADGRRRCRACNLAHSIRVAQRRKRLQGAVNGEHA